MKVIKRKIAELEKCYAIAPLTWHNRSCILVAAEKHAPCFLFADTGEYLDTVWTEPGGVMTMVQIPGKDGEFLATHQFYSPNDSADARLVYVYHEEGQWVVQTLTELPFVHRFDLIERDGNIYLLACTLKSAHAYKDDWSSPGKVYAAVLPKDLKEALVKGPLHLEVVMDGLLKNHGYTRTKSNNMTAGVVSCENGVFCFTPPSEENGSWGMRRLIEHPASDAVMADLDGDGKPELFVMTPFHGDTLQVYKEMHGKYELQWEWPEKMEFLHAVYPGTFLGKPGIVFGFRKGKRALCHFYYDDERKEYMVTELDTDCGPANVYVYKTAGKEHILAANRETDEIALYTCENGK